MFFLNTPFREGMLSLRHAETSISGLWGGGVFGGVGFGFLRRVKQEVENSFMTETNQHGFK